MLHPRAYRWRGGRARPCTALTARARSWRRPPTPAGSPAGCRGSGGTRSGPPLSARPGRWRWPTGWRTAGSRAQVSSRRRGEGRARGRAALPAELGAALCSAGQEGPGRAGPWNWRPVLWEGSLPHAAALSLCRRWVRHVVS